MIPHPIVVHFPIALLTIYALFEFARFKKLTRESWYFFVKAVLVVIGTLGSYAAYLTGPGTGGVRIAEIHQRFAIITAIIFTIISLAYIGEWAKPSKHSLFVMRPYIIIPLALLGLAAITITGGLGGAMVYGTNFDPFMAPIFKLLGV